MSEFTKDQLDSAFNDGYSAAMEGQVQGYCPNLPEELRIEWVKGWQEWHSEGDEK
jgi:ribosome modulation factor